MSRLCAHLLCVGAAGRALGCASEEPARAPAGATTSAWTAFLPGTCDAGDEAFVRRVLPFVWGRQPRSSREVALLVQMLRQTDRASLLAAMMDTEAYRSHWQGFVRHAFLPGLGALDNACEGPPRLAEPSPALAEHVRDRGPADPPFPGDWNITDLTRSVVALDDMSPWFRAAIFTMFLPPTNGLDPEELALRRAASDLFQASYLNRRVGCLGCHNSEFSVTGSSDPELDRTWELPGLFEKAIYGNSTGRAEADVAAMFRTMGVLSMDAVPPGEGPPWWVLSEAGIAPWGISGECGKFLARAEIGPDKLGSSGFLIRSFGASANVWDLEDVITGGIERLRREGLVVAADHEVDGEAGLVYLTSARFVEAVWEYVTGRPLTAPHTFPRNRYQLLILKTLTDAFIASGFSLETVLSLVLTHPYLNEAPPDTCHPSPYPFFRVFDSWVDAEQDAARRSNGIGDVVQRYPPEILLGAVTEALGWPPFSEYLDEGEGSDQVDLSVGALFLQDIGITVDDIKGFRASSLSERLAWEEGFGTCTDPRRIWDGEADPPPPDWIDRLVEAASPDQTLADAVVALKDRLVTAPSLDDPEERQRLEALMEQPLSARVQADPDAATVALRRVCAALLLSPQFLLAGLPLADNADAAPALAVPGGSTPELCADLARILGGGSWARCDPAGGLVPMP